MIKTFSGVQVTGLAAAVPAQIREMRNLVFPDLDIDRTIRSTGIETSRVAEGGLTAADLVESAARRLMADLKISARDIEALVFVSGSPDYLFPPTSHLLQAHLGLDGRTLCQDLSFTCSGFAHGLLQACLLITSQTAKRVLLLVGDTPTQTLRPEDRSAMFVFGDAGSACLLERGADDITVCTHADGSVPRAIINVNSGHRHTEEADGFLMNGLEVFNFALKRAPEVVDELLIERKLSKKDIGAFVFHQASQAILDGLAHRLGIPAAQVPSSVKSFGNTSSASIPLTIVTHPEARAARTLVCGFGSGLSWTGALLALDRTHISPLQEIRNGR